MDIKQMQYFLSVSKTQNLTKSAEELYVSQPTLSVAMKKLEMEVGTSLFVRTGTHIFLTDAGATLSEEADAVLQQYNQMERLVHSGDLNRDYIRLGFSTIVGNSIAPEVCKGFQEDNPDMRIRLAEDYGIHLLQKLERNQLDVVLTGAKYAEQARWKEKFESLDLKGFRLVYCVGRESPYACRKSITLQEISTLPIILLSDNFPISRGIEQSFQEHGYPMNIAFRTTQMFTVERFIAAGVAAGFLPKEACRGNRNLVPLTVSDGDFLIPHPVKLYWQKKQENDLPVKMFLHSIKKRMAADQSKQKIK